MFPAPGQKCGNEFAYYFVVGNRIFFSEKPSGEIGKEYAIDMLTEKSMSWDNADFVFTRK
jgi:hypothetical protein